VFLVIAVASLCAVGMFTTLVALACRHRRDLWITSDFAILCVVSPVLILLVTFGAVAIGYRLTHGGLSAIPAEGWIGALIVLAISAGIWRALARHIRRGVPARRATA